MFRYTFIDIELPKRKSEMWIWKLDDTTFAANMWIWKLCEK
jgi:hypothetical protein